MYNSYSSYLGASKCCNIRTQGAEGPQGTQGKKGPIGPSGGPTGPTGTRGPQGIISFGTSTSGNMTIYNPTEPTKISQTNTVQLDNLGNINLTGDVIPSVPGSATTGYNLGSLTNPWKKLYVASNSVEFVSSTGATGSIGLDDQSVFYSTNGIKSTFVNIGPSGTNPENFRGYSITSDATTEELLTQKIVGESPTGPKYLLNTWEKIDNEVIYSDNNVAIGESLYVLKDTSIQGGLVVNKPAVFYNETQIQNKLNVGGQTKMIFTLDASINDTITASVLPSNTNPFSGVTNPDYTYYFFNDINAVNTFTFSGLSDNAVINYVVVGGGGGGGGGGYNDPVQDGGGGAGGGGGQILSGYTNLIKYKNITINLGRGGTGGNPGTSTFIAGGLGSNGSRSSFIIEDTITIESLGGNGGGGGKGATATSGKVTGGSGGNGGGYKSGSTTGQGATCTSDGYAKNGSAGKVSTDKNVGGGGGAGWGSGKDLNNSTSSYGAKGGTVSVTFADGTTALSSFLLGTGGTGGGGNGVNSNGGGGSNGKNGSGNAGQGGYNGGTGGTGGSGCVLLYYLNTQEVQTSTPDNPALIVEGNSRFYNDVQFDANIINTVKIKGSLEITTGNETSNITNIFSGNFKDIAISSDLKYQTAVSTNGLIYRSTDGGITFSSDGILLTPYLEPENYIPQTPQEWTSCAMSSSGQYQVACCFFINGDIYNNNIYTSGDYGVTWLGISYSYNLLISTRSVAMSSDGKYIYILGGADDVVTGDEDYWLLKGIYNAANSWSFAVKFTSADNNKRPMKVATDDSGKYVGVTFVNRACPFSKNYGDNWSDAAFTSSSSGGYGIAISGNGYYKTIGNNYYPVVRSNGDPNSTWSFSTSGIYFSTLLNYTLNPLYYLSYISMAKDGKCQIGIDLNKSGAIVFSQDYGVNWCPVSYIDAYPYSIKIYTYVTSIDDLQFVVATDRGIYKYTYVDRTSLKLSGGANIKGTCSANSFFTPSDYRIKKNVTSEFKSELLNQLRPVKYFNINNMKTEYGFIAHEVQEVIPELVEGEKDAEEMQSLNYTAIVPILVKKIQENDVTIKALEERISKLEKKD